MKCPHCHEQNDASARFCESCGTALARRCPGCAREVGARARFCPACGSPLDAVVHGDPVVEARRLGGERRQLTVMFCDLVGSTALSNELDAELLRELVTTYQQRCGNVVAPFGGHVAQYLGDGILVYFGFPTAHEDDAARAVLSGLRIVDEIRALSAELSRPLGVRIGVHTGAVVIGEMGRGDRRQQLALGDTPNIAARIQSLAAPGALVISQSTQRLVHGLFDCRDLGPNTLAGIAKPIELYEVVGTTGASNRFEVARRGGLAALIGRDGELAGLERRWRQAASGSGQAVLIAGEAGIGKSRLVQALRDVLEAEGVTPIEFRCSPYHLNTPLHPIIDYLERLLEFRKGERGEEKLARLEQRISGLRTLPADALPLLAALLVLPHPPNAPQLRLAPQLQKQRTFEAMVAWLMEASASRPMLNVWEDLHWADPSTLEFLDLLLQRIADGPTLSIFTHRPEFVPPWPVRPHVSRVDLARLGEADVHAVVRGVTSGALLPEPVMRHIATKTDGVPLLVEELTKTILDSGVVTRADGHYVLSGPLESLAIPATLRDSLMARLDGLGPSKEIAQLAAVLGRDFSYELIEAIAPIAGDELRKSLAVLVDAELLIERDGAPDPHDAFRHYVFKHALIQDTAYESLLRSRRQQVHGQVALLLEGRFSDAAATHPELLAHHYTEAGLREPAARYWLAAGEQSAKRSANLEAVNQLERGLALVRGLPESTPRDLQELSLLVALGVPLVAVRGYSSPEVAQVFVRARELCARLGDLQQLCSVLFRLRSFALVHGDVDEALELGAELVRLAEDAANADLRVEAYYALGAARMYWGDLRGTLEAFAKIDDVYDPVAHRGHAYVFGQDPKMAQLAYQAWALGFMGQHDRAAEKAQQAVAQADWVGHPFSQAFAWAFKSLVHWIYRETSDAGAAAERAIAVSREHGFPFWMALSSPFLGWAQGMSGDLDQGIALIERGIAAFRATGAELGVPHFYTLLAELNRRAGRLDAGLRAADDGLAAVRRYRDNYYTTAELYREKGELLRARGRSGAEVEDCFELALHFAREQGAKWLELRAHVSRGRLWQSVGRGAAARAPLNAAIEAVQAGDRLEDLRCARELLAELSDTR
jgi:class 3 adenylate cyclase/predicted ATPase